MREKDQIEKNDTEYDEARLEETLDIFMQMRAVDKAKGYRKIVEPVNRRARRRQFILLSRYAAVIVVIVVVGIIWGVRGRVDHAVPVIQVQEITPGEMKAKLILATGENVLLDTLSLRRTVIQEAGVTIQKANGVLTYEHSGKEDVHSVEVVYNTLEVPRGGEYDVVLEDGTRVWLNADSRLKYPVVFPGNERRVILEGEAYFEVAKDTNRPFWVKKVDVQQVAAWKKGVFVFENQNLEQIMLKLARWYNVMVFFQNEGAKAIEFKGNLPKYSNFKSILQVIEKSSNVKFDVQGQTVVVSI